MEIQPFCPTVFTDTWSGLSKRSSLGHPQSTLWFSLPGPSGPQLQMPPPTISWQNPEYPIHVAQIHLERCPASINKILHSLRNLFLCIFSLKDLSIRKKTSQCLYDPMYCAGKQEQNQQGLLKTGHTISLCHRISAGDDAKFSELVWSVMRDAWNGCSISGGSNDSSFPFLRKL